MSVVLAPGSGHPGCGKEGGLRAAAPQRPAQGPAGTPARPGLGPRPQRPSLHPTSSLSRRDRQEEADPAPPRPLCFEAPSPVPTLGAPGVTQAQRLWEGWPPPPPPRAGETPAGSRAVRGAGQGRTGEAIPRGGSGAGSGAGSASRVVQAAGRPLQVRASRPQALDTGRVMKAQRPGVTAGWAQSDHPAP